MALGTTISRSTAVFSKILSRSRRPMYVSHASCMFTLHYFFRTFRASASLPYLQCKRLLKTIADPQLHTYIYKDRALHAIKEGLRPRFRSSLKPLPEVSVETFFARAKVIAVIVDVLNKGVLEVELLSTFGSLQITDNFLVTQILRGDLPCDIALNFFHWLKCQPGFQHNEYTYGVMLNNLGRAGHLDDMQQLFDQMKAEGCRVTLVTLVNIMGWFFKAKDMRRVAYHWTALRRSGIKPSAAMYAARIEFVIATNRHFQVEKIFEEMLRLGCLPNSRTYSLFIEHLVNADNVEAGDKIMKLMHSMKVVPTNVTYITMINGFARLGHIERVLEILGEMREHFYRPTKHLLPAIKVLQAAGKFQEASSLLGELLPDSAQDIGNDMQVCNDEDMDAVDDADSVTIVWRSAACSHFVFDIGSFVNALYDWNQNVESVLELENIQWERALVLGLFRRLKTLESLWPFFHRLSRRAGFKHDSYTCASLIQTILKSALSLEKMDYLVRELFKGLIRDGITLAVPLFNLVIRHYVAVGEAEKAGNMLELLKDVGLKPNEFTYALVIQGFSRQNRGKKATEMVQEMEDRGFRLDENTRADLINCFGLAGKTDRAFALFCKVSELGGKPSCPEYKAILATFLKAGEHGRALKLYEDMRKAGIVPTQDMYNVVTELLHKVCRFSEIQSLSQERALLKFFDGKKKALQESLLEVLFTFMRGLRRNFRRKNS
ncbi:hypothetical protein L7F22_064512 [Adiantum nelumboides]|nr:hypothetical protein [Adiantum nelumboides]